MINSNKVLKLKDLKILVKGGGDQGSGVAWRLFKAGFNVAVMDLPNPLSLRRKVTFSTAITEGAITVEGVAGKSVKDELVFSQEYIPVFTNEDAKILESFTPDVLIDATFQSLDNPTTGKDDALFTVGLGPGFKAPENIDCIVETKRGHNLGKVIWEGEAEKYTGIPGDVEGYSEERVIRAPENGKVKYAKQIGDRVQKDELIGWIGQKEIRAPLHGIIRGLITEHLHVESNSKIGDIDPRGIKEYVYTISDKARSIAGGVLEAVMIRFNS